MNITEIRQLMNSRVVFKDWAFIISYDYRMMLQVCTTTLCNISGKSMLRRGRKWVLSEHMTKSEVVQTALAAVLAAVEHEAREQFKFDGFPIFDPHYDIDELWKLRTSPRCLSVRKEKQ